MAEEQKKEVRKKIVIVDNDAIFAKTLERFITEKREFYDVITVAEEEIALKTVKETEPDLIILDVNFPKIGALELYKKILNAKEGEKNKVLILTKRAELEDIFDQLEAECFITKTPPFDIFFLLNEIDRMISKKDRQMIFVMDIAAKPVTKHIKMMLRRGGYKPIILEGFGTFMTTIMEKQPTCIILEYEQQDVITGQDCIRKMREVLIKLTKTIWKNEMKVFIIVYTSGDGEFKGESFTAGADYYMGKLSKPEVIMEKLKDIQIERQKIQKEIDLKKLLALEGPAKQGPKLSDFSSLGF